MTLMFNAAVRPAEIPPWVRVSAFRAAIDGKCFARVYFALGLWDICSDSTCGADDFTPSLRHHEQSLVAIVYPVRDSEDR